MQELINSQLNLQTLYQIATNKSYQKLLDINKFKKLNVKPENELNLLLTHEDNLAFKRSQKIYWGRFL